MDVELPFAFNPGDLADIDHVGHVLERIDPDGVFTIRRLGSQRMFEVTDRDGFRRKPIADDVLRLMADDRIILRDPELEDPTARQRRKAQYDRADARAADALCDIRVGFGERYDQHPCNLSDKALQAFMREQYDDPDFRALPGAYRTDSEGRLVPHIRCGKTLRDWIQHRGRPGDRRLRDGVSRTGKVPRRIRIDHPEEIVAHWLAVQAGSKRDIKKDWERYAGELRRVSRGDPTGRVDGDREPIVFPKPKKKHEPLSYWAFRRLSRKTRSKAATKARYNGGAAEAEFGGSGVLDTPTHVGSHCTMDDTRVPALVKVVVDGDVWVGQPTWTHIFDPFANLIPGFDLSWDEASSATVLRTVAHASQPKSIPADLDADFPELKSVFYLPDRIKYDNLAAHHGESVVDALKDLGTETDFTGAGMASDKSEMERSIGTVLNLAIKGLPCSVDPIALRRWHKGDPSPDLLPTLERLRVLFTRAICTFQIADSSGIGGRAPLHMFLKATASRKVNVIRNHDQFVAAIGVVEYDVSLSAHGIELFGGNGRLRYTDPIHGAGLFERIVGSQRPAKRGGDSAPVKLKYHPDNLLVVHVWDPVEKRYVTLTCDRPDYARDLPKWMHEMIVASMGEDTRQFISEDTLLEFRKRLFDQQANITQAAEERERRNAGKVMDSAIFKRVMGNVVRVDDEDPYGMVDAPDIGTFDHVVGTELSSVTSLDAEQPTPRKPDSTTRANINADAASGVKTPRRRLLRAPTSTQDRRDAGRPAANPGSSTSRPERPRSPSNQALKWNQ